MSGTIWVTILSVTMFLTSLIFTLVALALPFALAIGVALLVAVLLRDGRAAADFRPPGVVAAAGSVLLIYLAGNALTAPDVGQALGKVAACAGIFGACLLGVRGAGMLGARREDSFTAALIAGVVAGAGVAAFEIVFGFLVTEFLYEQLPDFVWSERDKGFTVVDGEVLKISAYVFNKNITGLSMIAWPALLIATHWPRRGAGLALAAGIAGLAAIAIGGSENLTATVALIGGLTVFALASWWPKIVHWLLVTCWIGGFVVAIPAAAALGPLALTELDFLPRSAKSRLLIWDYTAERIAEHPLIGIGVRGTRHHQKQAARQTRPESELEIELIDPALTRRPGWHAHNLFLQSWYEIGAIGVVLLASLGLAVLARLRRAGGEFRAWHYGFFATVVLTATFGWGMWQGWLLAGIALAAVLMNLATSFALRHNERSRGPAETTA